MITMTHRTQVTLPQALLFTLVLGALASCSSTESQRTIETQQVATQGTPYSGPRYALSVGRFSNASPYMRGIFSSQTEDRLGDQARTILETQIGQTNRFDLLDRSNMTALAQESRLAGKEQTLDAAEIVLTGQVTEFGRRTTGDHQLFGILGRGKTQTAYSVVSLNVVDVSTSRVLFSTQGAGEYSLSDREVIGFGSTSGYDSTLNGKVLSSAIIDAVNKVVAALEAGTWRPTGDGQ